jgi:hypothetical protein
MRATIWLCAAALVLAAGCSKTDNTGDQDTATGPADQPMTSPAPQTMPPEQAPPPEQGDMTSPDTTTPGAAPDTTTPPPDESTSQTPPPPQQ